MKKRLCTWAMIALAVLLIHDLMLIVGCSVIHGNVSFENLKTLIWDRLTVPGDAERYLQIARDGYATEGEHAINLVFYPLYPLLIRIFSFGVLDLAAVGMVLSRLMLMGAGIALYELALMDGNGKTAWMSVLLMSVYPFSMFTVGVYTESLFLFLSILCMLFIRRNKMICAGIVGFLAALTRVQGMLLIFPAVYHVVEGRLGEEKREITFRDAFLLLIPLGFCVYLCINAALHGDPFKFMEYEAGEPWYQSTKWIAENISTQYHNALNFKGLETIIYWPQIVLYFLTLMLIFLGMKQGVRMEYLLYAGVYLGFTYLSGWMISGGRYMLCCFPVYLILAGMKNEKMRWASVIVSACFFFLYSLMFLQGYAIM